jgi:hypothetical protein
MEEELEMVVYPQDFPPRAIFLLANSYFLGLGITD